MMALVSRSSSRFILKWSCSFYISASEDAAVALEAWDLKWLLLSELAKAFLYAQSVNKNAWKYS